MESEIVNRDYDMTGVQRHSAVPYSAVRCRSAVEALGDVCNIPVSHLGISWFSKCIERQEGSLTMSNSGGLQATPGRLSLGPRISYDNRAWGKV